MPEDTTLWSVIDKNATALIPGTDQIQPRSHTTRPGKTWQLRSDSPTAMPEPDARLFLADPSFVVMNALGDVVPGLSEALTRRVVPSTALPASQVIADLHELTHDALLTRASVRPGFIELPPNPDTGLLLDFLVGQFTVVKPRGNEDDLDGDGTDALTLADRLLQGE